MPLVNVSRCVTNPMQPSDTRASQSAMQPASVWEELSDTPGGSLQPGDGHGRLCTVSMFCTGQRVYPRALLEATVAKGGLAGGRVGWSGGRAPLAHVTETQFSPAGELLVPLL